MFIEELKAQNEHRSLRGGQIAFMIYGFSRSQRRRVGIEHVELLHCAFEDWRGDKDEESGMRLLQASTGDAPTGMRSRVMDHHIPMSDMHVDRHFSYLMDTARTQLINCIGCKGPTDDMRVQ